MLRAGIILCFYAFDLPQFRGVRMAAVVVLFLLFGAASLPLTYLLSFNFSDEMRALQVCPALDVTIAGVCLEGVWVGVNAPSCRFRLVMHLPKPLLVRCKKAGMKSDGFSRGLRSVLPSGREPPLAMRCDLRRDWRRGGVRC